MSATEFEKSVVGFRQHLPDLNTPRFEGAKDQDAHEYAKAFQETHHPPWLYALTEAWKRLLEEPYSGVTTDGIYLCFHILPSTDYRS